MAEVILMPRLSDTMTEGVIASWHKKIGDSVKKGDLLAEIETDKATMELESYKDGTLLHIGGDNGVKIQVDELLAIIGKPGEDITSLLGGKSPAPQDSSNNKQEVKEKKQNSSEEKKQPAADNTEAKTGTAVDVSKIDGVVLMPRLSDTMEEGVIASWHKNVGDSVKKGEVLAEIETDKATMELESYRNGTLLHIGAEKGEKIPVNGLLCIIGEKGKIDVEAIVAGLKNGGTVANSVSAEPELKATKSADDSNSESQPSNVNTDGRIKASPLAKRLAADKGIDISRVQGTGDGGRIVKSDIDNFKPGTASKSPDQASSAPAATVPAFTKGEESYTDIPNSQQSL